MHNSKTGLVVNTIMYYEFHFIQGDDVSKHLKV